MLRRLRRGDKVEKTRPDFSPNSSRPNFLDLPAELRIVIYDLIVEGTTLTLVERKDARALTPSMLLASRQVRAEYQPVLLRRARIVANVYKYDFRRISSMASSLYSKELKLLRMNEHMVIRLHCLRCKIQDLDSLRRWLVQRADSLDRLPWTYEVGWPGTTIALSAKPDMLVGHLEMLLEMKSRMRLDERLGYELLPVCHGIQKELGAVLLQLGDHQSTRRQPTYLSS